MRDLAARGGLTWDAVDQLEFLLFLLNDPEVGAVAKDTLEAIPRAVLAAFLARPETTPALRAAFAAGVLNRVRYRRQTIPRRP